MLRNATFTQPRARCVGLEDGRYRLAVRAINVQGIPGEEATRDLVVNARPPSPLLLEPRPGSRLPTSDIELLCTEGAGVEGYRFQLARDTGFTDLIDIASDAVRCHHTAQALPPGRYQWRVAAVSRDVGGLRDQGPFSQAVAFTVVALPPVPQGLLLDTGMPDTLAIQWGAGLGGPWRFRIQHAMPGSPSCSKTASSPHPVTPARCQPRASTTCACNRSMPTASQGPGRATSGWRSLPA